MIVEEKVTNQIIINMRTIIPVMITVAVFSSCNVKQSECNRIKSELETIKKHVVQDSICISNLRDTISMLSQPADQRLASINKLVSDGDYDKARKEIHELNNLFPNSIESKKANDVLQRIDNLIEKQQAEKERIKAMGFKALKPSLSALIGYNKVTISSVGISKSFHFDSYDDGGFKRTADRDNTYVVASMSVTSSSKDPDLPTLAVYSINGDQMNREGVMEVRFAYWQDYGHYLGNYPDYGNDFAKTSTIRFKLGVEVPIEVTKKAYAVVLKKHNGLSRNYNRYNNPPVSYSGSSAYPFTLSLDDFNKDNSQYVIIKIANL